MNQRINGRRGLSAIRNQEEDTEIRPLPKVVKIVVENVSDGSLHVGVMKAHDGKDHVTILHQQFGVDRGINLSIEDARRTAEMILFITEGL